MVQHTAGKWKIINDAQGPCMIMHPHKKGVAIASLSDCFNPVNGMHDPTNNKGEFCKEINGQTYRAERVANARLIAAAPELLEACKKAVETLKCFSKNTHTIEIIEKAIAKAEGR